MSRDEISFGRDELRTCLLEARRMLLPPNPVDASANGIRIALARCFEAIGDPAGADSLYAAVLASNPSHEKALRGRVGAAIAAGALAPAAAPGEAEALLIRARELLERRHHAAADGMFRQLATIEPKRPDGWIGQADVALAEGRPSLAIAACEEGLKNCPDDQGLVLKRALGLQRVGRPLEAVGLLKTQLQRHPGRVVFRNALARAHAAAGEIEAAGAIYAQVMSENPHNRGALLGRVDLASAENDFKAARAACDAALAVFPDDPILARKMARTLTGLGRHREAVALLERLKRQGSSGTDVDFHLARAHLASGQPDLAEELFREILEADPYNGRAVLALADVAEKRGDVDGALALMEQTLQSKS